MANGTGANLGFEDKLWAAADKLRGTMDAAEYKHVVLGLIFLKYISDAFMEMHDRLAVDDYAEAEDRDEYLAENVFWVPAKALWSFLRDHATVDNDPREGGRRRAGCGALSRPTPTAQDDLRAE